MPDFTVIDGGAKPHDFEADAAGRALERLVIEVLRALARGDDGEDRVRNALIRLSEHSGAATIPLHEIIGPTILELHREAFPGDRFEGKYSCIVEDSLRLAAESMAQDSFAAGRKSSRRTELHRTIETYLMGEEKLSRDNGGFSYFADLAKKADRLFGKWKPKKRPPPQMRRGD